MVSNEPLCGAAAVAEGLVYSGSGDGYLYTLDERTSQERWRYQTPDPIRSSPAIHNGVVYFGSLDSNLFAVE